MTTKLTVKIDTEVAMSARRYSERRGRSLDQLVADLLKSVSSAERESAASLTPIVCELKGALKGKRLHVADYRRHLEDKHR